MSCISTKNENTEGILNSENIANQNNNVQIIPEAEKKLNFFEMNLKLRNKINIDYADFDFQKGESSPKYLFRKRKIDYSDNAKYLNNMKENDKSFINNISNKNTNIVNEEQSNI